MNTFDRLLKVCSAVFEEELSLDGVTPESSLREDVGIHSIGLLYMAMALEEEFGIRFTNEDFADIVTVADVIRTIEKKVG